MAAEFPIPLTTSLDVASLVLELFIITGLIPDPLSWLLGLFGGRPTMQATYDEATIFIGRTSPVLKLLGVGAALCLNDGIPLSSTDAAPLFGPYFEAAVIIENAIRWGSQDTSVQTVDTATLSAAMTEAGNPGVAGTATMDAVDQAWSDLSSQPLKEYACASLQVWVGYGLTADLVRAFGTQYNDHLYPGGPINFGPPQPTGGGGGGGGGGGTGSGTLITAAQALAIITTYLPADASWLAGQNYGGTKTLGEWETFFQAALTARNAGTPSNTITIGQAYGTLVTGIVTLTVTVQGGPFPYAHINFLIDGNLIAVVPDGSTSATEPVTVSTQWNSGTVWNGDHILMAQWQGIRGDIHAQNTTLIIVADSTVQWTGGQGGGHPPPNGGQGGGQGGGGGGGGGGDGAGSPTSWPWFVPCQEAITCGSLTEEGLAMAQQLANVAHAALTLPLAIGTALGQDCTTPLITELERLRASLNNIVAAFPPPANFQALTAQVKCICDQLVTLTKVEWSAIIDLDPVAENLAGISRAIEQLTAKIEPVDLSQVVEQLKRRNDDLQVPDDWKTALLDSKALPPALAGLLQSTIWDTVAGATGAALGHVLGWGEAEVEGAAAKIGRFIIYPIANLIATLWHDIVTSFDTAAGPSIGELSNAASKLATFVGNIMQNVVGVGIGELMGKYAGAIEGINLSTTEGVEQAVGTLLGYALLLGQGAHGLAVLGELPYFTKHLGLGEMAALVAEFSGFREILRESHGPFLRAALGRPAGYAFNRKYSNTLPPPQAGLLWWARGLLSTADAQMVANSAGYSGAWEATMFNAAYRPVSPRALATLMQDQPLDVQRMTAILQDNAYSPANVQFMLSEFEYASTKNVRNAYINEAISAYQHGVMPDAELNDILDSVGWSPDAKKFVIDRAALARRVTLAGKVEAQIIPLVAQGLISPDVGTQQMEAAGVQKWYTDLEVTLATTKATLHAAKLEATAEHKAELERQRNLTRAAVAEYHSGRVDTVGLTAALAALGLDASLVASIVAVNEAMRAGRLKLVYGQLLAPEDAAVLKERIATIEQQTKDQLIHLDSARAQLTALKVPPLETDALIARWAATLKKTPGASVLVNPYTGALETAIA